MRISPTSSVGTLCVSVFDSVCLYQHVDVLLMPLSLLANHGRKPFPHYRVLSELVAIGATAWPALAAVVVSGISGRHPLVSSALAGRIQAEILVSQQLNSWASSWGLPPTLTISTICWRNSGPHPLVLDSSRAPFTEQQGVRLNGATSSSALPSCRLPTHYRSG